MKYSVKTELWKATHNPYFLLSLLVGFILVLCNLVETSQNVQKMTMQTIDAIEHGVPLTGFMGCSLFVWWIGCNGLTFGSTCFFQVWPVLAAMPFSWSLSQEAKSGALYQYATRGSRKNYFYAKFLAVFISGGLAVALPLLADLLLNALICPDISLLFYNAMTSIENSYFLSALFYTHPWAYCLCWCFIDFLWGGSAAVLSILSGTGVRFTVLAMLVPMAVISALGAVGTTLIRITGTALMLNPLYLTMAAPFGANPAWLLFSTMGVFVVISFLAGYRRVVKNDLLYGALS